ncbi:MAG TPA: hypothetical protein VIU86_04835 [Gaiellaceae bacterium]
MALAQELQACLAEMLGGPTTGSYSTASGAGTVAAILVAPAAEAPLQRVGAAEALPGKGLAGDRYLGSS